MNNSKAEADLARLLEQAKAKVTIGARYRHYKGFLYHVVSIGLYEED